MTLPRYLKCSTVFRAVSPIRMVGDHALLRRVKVGRGPLSFQDWLSSRRAGRLLQSCWQWAEGLLLCAPLRHSRQQTVPLSRVSQLFWSWPWAGVGRTESHSICTWCICLCRDLWGHGSSRRWRIGLTGLGQGHNPVWSHSRSQRGQKCHPRKNMANHAIVEEADNVSKFSRATKVGENDAQCFSVHRLEGLCEVDEDSIEVHPLLDAFFLDLSHREAHVDGAAAWSEATLWLWQWLFGYRTDETIHDDLCENLPSGWEKWDEIADSTCEKTVSLFKGMSGVPCRCDDWFTVKTARSYQRRAFRTCR